MTPVPRSTSVSAVGVVAAATSTWACSSAAICGWPAPVAMIVRSFSGSSPSRWAYMRITMSVSAPRRVMATFAPLSAASFCSAVLAADSPFWAYTSLCMTRFTVRRSPKLATDSVFFPSCHSAS